MFTRRTMILAAAALPVAAGADAWAVSRDGFVTVDGAGFRLGGRPYRFVGANLWYGAWLGMEGADGDRARLGRELDALKAMGVTNLRVLGGSEDSPLKNSIKPAMRDRDGENEALLSGLDVLLAEMGRRDMKAVIYLTNFWEWSGGMMTYLYWTNGGRYLDMNDPAHPWPAFPDFAAGFYSQAEAIALYHDHVRAVVGRVNTVTGVAHAQDPTIMAWQLANEPRPGGTEAIAAANLPAYYRWIGETAALIRRLDPNHLVSTGSEGLKGCIEQQACVVAAHASPDIDYVTAHIWPQNWSWVDPDDLEATMPEAERLVGDYIMRHRAIARDLNKPLVIEEFGFPRDAGYRPGTPATLRDRFYGRIHAAVETDAREGGPLAGSNFWAWGGEGRPAHDDAAFHPGDAAFVGDPPHEPQGWYSVFDADASTRALIRRHADEMARITARSAR